jgi:hypothetical protein
MPAQFYIAERDTKAWLKVLLEREPPKVSAAASVIELHPDGQRAVFDMPLVVQGRDLITEINDLKARLSALERDS